MKQTVDLYTFRQAFEKTRPSNFSYEGLKVLFDYLESLEQDLGEHLMFDVIGLCCDCSEDTPKEIADKYFIDLTDCEDESDVEDVVYKWLNNHTSVCGKTDTTIVYCSLF